MTRIRWIVLGSAISVLASTSNQAQAKPPVSGAALTKMVEAMASRGEISRQDAKKLKQLADKSPTGKGVDGMGRRCHTQAVRAVRQWAESEGVPVFRSPPAFTQYLESKKFPLRVHYNAETDKDLAQLTLAATEDAWQKQIVEAGYPAPYTGPDEGPVAPGLWTYISDSGMGGGGYTEPLLEVADTPNSDCSVRVVIDRKSTPGDAPATITHEFNHSTQAATDCAEAISAWEGFASAVESHYFGVGFDHQQSIGVFQRNPDFSLDFWTSIEEDSTGYYQYGAMIFPFYLQDRFGGGELSFLRDLWNSFAQQGTISFQFGRVVSTPPNEPDWFEALDQVLKKKGSSFDEAFDEFSVWRAVAGNYDDKNHFAEGKRIPSVQVGVSMWLKAMPLSGQYAAHEYGSQYIQLYPTGYSGPVHVQVSSDPAATWGSSLLLWRKDQPVQRIPVAFKDSKGEVYLPSVDGLSRILLVVSQHKDQSHDPDEMEYDTTRSFDILVDAEVDPDAGPISEPVPEAGPELAPESGPSAGDSEAPEPGQADSSAPDSPVDTGASSEAAINGSTTLPTDNGLSGGCGCRLSGRSDATLPMGVIVGLGALAIRRRRTNRPVAAG